MLGNTLYLCHRSGFHCITDADSGLFQELFCSHLRLLNDFNRSVFQCLQRYLRTLCRKTRTHNHWNRVLAHKLLEKGDAIHPGHFNIKGNNVRDFMPYFFGGNKGICSYSHYFNPLVRGKDLRECLADYDGIINDQHLNFVIHS